MKRAILLLFAVFLGLGKGSAASVMDGTSADSVKFSSVVLDAESGEPLAMVGVYVSNDNTTLTNFEGEFAIKAHANDTIRLTCVGRKTLYIKAGELPDIIKMQMLPGTLSEVTIKAF